MTTPQETPPPSPRHSVRASSFNSVAAQYATARPGYPPALFDAIEELAERPLRGAVTLDVGAGTGIGTRLLHDRGARVTAVEPGPQMAAELRAADPVSALVRADGNALPFRSARFDLVTYAQSWHWTDPARSVPEAMRVLRPGGTLAMWWNEPDPDVPWSAAQEARLAAALPGYYQFGLTDQAPEFLRSHGHEPAVRILRWRRTISLETHLAHLGSHSFFASMGAEQARRVLEPEREALREVFPDGRVAEAYAVRLITVRAPGADGVRAPAEAPG